MNINEKIQNYQPTPDSIELVRKARIVLLAGIAGAGKDTIKRQLLEDNNFRDIVSHTTRQPRINNGVAEIDGQAYHFIDNDEASEMIDQRDFIEVKLVHSGAIYGTSVAEVRAGYDDDKTLITDVDVQGVDEFKELSSRVIAIFILPPSYSTWRKRLASRYQSEAEFAAEWPKRRDSAIDELNRALTVPYYHFVINDDLEVAVRATAKIANGDDEFNRKDDEARLAARDILEELKASS